MHILFDLTMSWALEINLSKCVGFMYKYVQWNIICYYNTTPHVWIWELDHKEGWIPKNWCFWSMVLEKTPTPQTAKRSNQSILKEIKSWIFIGRTDAEAETWLLGPSDAKNWLIIKDSDTGKDWRWEEKGTTEDEMVGWYHRLNGQVWTSFGRWWRAGRPGMLQSMGLQRVGRDWVAEQQQTPPKPIVHK